MCVCVSLVAMGLLAVMLGLMLKQRGRERLVKQIDGMNASKLRRTFSEMSQ